MKAREAKRCPALKAPRNLFGIYGFLIPLTWECRDLPTESQSLIVVGNSLKSGPPLTSMNEGIKGNNAWLDRLLADASASMN